MRQHTLFHKGLTKYKVKRCNKTNRWLILRNKQTFAWTLDEITSLRLAYALESEVDDAGMA